MGAAMFVCFFFLATFFLLQEKKYCDKKKMFCYYIRKFFLAPENISMKLIVSDN